MANQNQRRRQGGGRRGFEGPLPSPYNFVRLSDLVIDDWAKGKPSMDAPVAGGLSGRLEIEISNAGPILVSGPGDGVKRFHRIGVRDAGVERGPELPALTGLPTIPGSSIRGMVRAVVEIMTFSRFSRISDKRHGLRDLSGAAPEYTKQMTSGSRRSGFRSTSEAAWLSREVGAWRLRRCEHARVQHDDLEKIAAAHGNPQWRRDVRSLHGDKDKKTRPAMPRALETDPPTDPASLVAMYRIWRDAPRRLPMQVEVEPTGHRHSNNNTLIYAQAVPAGAPTRLDIFQTEGEIVFTGQPSPAKHMEFFFHSEDEETEEAPLELMRDFLDVNEGNPGWDFWRSRLDRGEIGRIPVFLATGEDGEVGAIGLSMMFRYPQTYSRHQLRDHTSPRHAGSPGFDMAERLFGRIDERGQADGAETNNSFRGRVSFADAPLANPGDTKEAGPFDTVLGAPKPQYFPAYVRQTNVQADRIRPNDAGKFVYRKYMKEPGSQQPELKGWKRYPARLDVMERPPEPPRGASKKAIVTLAPLAPKGAAPLRFRTRVRFHNLLPVELGALISALTLCGKKGARHSLGTGKPFGWGQVGLALTGIELEPNEIPEGDTDRTFLEGDEGFARLKSCAAAFVADADRRFDGAWRDSEQVQQLLSMAVPREAGDLPHPLRYPKLEIPGDNDFHRAKQAGAYLVDWPALDAERYSRPKAARRGPEPPRDGGSPQGSGREPNADPGLYKVGDKVRYRGGKSVLIVKRDQVNPHQQVHVQFPDGQRRNVPPAKLERVPD